MLIGFLFLFPHKLYSINISVIDIEFLINNNSDYLILLKKIDDGQKEYLEYFNLRENKLDN